MVTKAEARRKSKGTPWFSDNGWLDWVVFVLLLVLPFAVAAGSHFFPVEGVYHQVRAVYESASWAKPAWVPHPLAFPIAAGYSLFALGFASYIVWKVGGGLNETTVPSLLLYALHLPVAAALAHLFGTLGLTLIVAQILAALSAVVFCLFLSYFVHSKFAAVLLLPYLGLLVTLTVMFHHFVVSNGLSFDPVARTRPAAPAQPPATPPPKAAPPTPPPQAKKQEL